MTYEEFLALPENHNNMIYEWINGQVVKMARPNPRHAEVCGNLNTILKLYLYGKKCKVYFEIDVQFGEDENHNLSCVAPDLCIICEADEPLAQPYIGVPDLCIEILSKNKGNDLIKKRKLYLENGVREYWIVDPLHRYIWVNILKYNSEGKGYYDEHIYEEDIFHSTLFPDLLIDLRIVFDDGSLAYNEFLKYKLKNVLKLTKEELLKLLEEYDNDNQ